MKSIQNGWKEHRQLFFFIIILKLCRGVIGYETYQLSLIQGVLNDIHRRYVTRPSVLYVTGACSSYCFRNSTQRMDVVKLNRGKMNVYRDYIDLLAL